MESDFLPATTSMTGTVIEYLSGNIFLYRTRLFPQVKAKGAKAVFTIVISAFNTLPKIPTISPNE
jgi:hypothetical protein